MARYHLLLLCLVLCITFQPQKAHAGWGTQAWYSTAFGVLVAQDFFTMGVLGAPVQRDASSGNNTSSSSDGFSTSNIGIGVTLLGALIGKDVGQAILEKIGDAEWAKRLGTSAGACFCGCVESMRQFRDRRNVFMNLPDKGLLDGDLFELTTGIMRKGTKFQHAISPDGHLVRYVVPYREKDNLVTFYKPGEIDTIHNADLALAPLTPRFRTNLRHLIETMAGGDEYLKRDLTKKLGRWTQFNTVQYWSKLDVSEVHKGVHILVLGRYDPTTATDFHVGLKISIIQNAKATTTDDISILLNTNADGDIAKLPLDAPPITWLRAAEQNYLGPEYDDDGDIDEDDAFNPVELRALMNTLMERGITLDQFMEEGMGAGAMLAEDMYDGESDDDVYPSDEPTRSHSPPAARGQPRTMGRSQPSPEEIDVSGGKEETKSDEDEDEDEYATRASLHPARSVNRGSMRHSMRRQPPESDAYESVPSRSTSAAQQRFGQQLLVAHRLRKQRRTICRIPEELMSQGPGHSLRSRNSSSSTVNGDRSRGAHHSQPHAAVLQIPPILSDEEESDCSRGSHHSQPHAAHRGRRSTPPEDGGGHYSFV